MNDKNETFLSESERALRERVAEAGEELPEGLHERVSAAVSERIAAERVRENARKIRAARRFAVGFAACFILFAAAGAILLMPLSGRTGEAIPTNEATAAEIRTEAAPLLPESPDPAQEAEGAATISADEKNTTLQPTSQKTSDDAPTSDPAKESSQQSANSEDGRRVTTMILILAGLLAVASFIAFIISLSDVRRRTAGLLPNTNDKDETK